MFLPVIPNSQKSILVINDTVKELLILSEYLKSDDYNVITATNGRKGLEAAKRIVPDLIILDAVMPKNDGFKTIKCLKENIKTQKISVVFTTPLTDKEIQLRSFKLGGIDCITTPLEREEFLARIKTHLTIHLCHLNTTVVAQQQKLLFEVSERIRKSLNLKTVFQTATDEILNFLKCDRVSLVSLKKSQISIEAESRSNLVTRKSLYPITLDALHCQEKEYFDNVHFCQLKYSSCKLRSIKKQSLSTQSQIRSIFPIWIERESGLEAKKDIFFWGCLIIDRFQDTEAWQQPGIDLMKLLITQLEIAIQQGLLYKQLQNSNLKLKQLAWHDCLTQLFNRRYFDRQLNLEWRRLKRLKAPISIIMCDVDCFKLYNDSYGHQQGDKCLQAVATAIASTLNRSGDILARYGGEEFIAILPNTSLEGAIQVAETMRRKVKELNMAHLNSLVNSVVTMSLGVANTIPDSQTNPNLLVKAADCALYTAKQRGRDCLAVYRDCLDRSSTTQIRELEWNQRLRQALDRDLFSLYAQPIEALGLDDQKRHFEILLRLSDRGDKILTPNDFLEVAERHCLMPNIDTWVIDNLLSTLAKFESKDWHNYHFSINLSGASLNQEGFLDYLFGKLSSYHLPPSIFCFEITETIAISNLGKVSNFIESLKNIGCSFALDDFGKGMSSLTYLKNLPVDYLKIDGSFIKELNNDSVSRAMVEAIHHLAGAMGLKTVAEFVEDRSILNTLRDLKVDYAQGYYFGRPAKLMDIIG